MMKLLSALAFIAKYILIGLGIAALLVLLMPEKFNLNRLIDFNSQTQTEAQIQALKPTSDPATLIAKAKAAVVTLQVGSKAYPINSRQCFDNVRNHSSEQNACTFVNNGSGVIIDKEGYLITSAHVVTFSSRGQIFDQAESIIVSFNDSKTHSATIVGIDRESDLALLKLNNPNNLIEHFLPLATNKNTQVGETVYAIGTPYMGFEQTVTSGIISAKFFAKVSNYLQTDAQLRSGNSGGALINANGDLIGITQLSTQEVSGEQLLQNFAITAPDVARIASQLKQYGKVKRGWLGFSGDMSINLASISQERQLNTQQVAELESAIKQLPFGLGIVVTGLHANGPAEQAGLQLFDIVTKVNELPLYNSTDLLGAIWNKAPDDRVTVTYWRNGQEFKTEVVLGTKS
ncbi:S1C family serine protease [Kangiella sp. TOML190]|uniref:S1C family serine protease n=1 Tax=Kangiella sp. TOML190 TaxID=2931351 RepID=UPI00203EA095|nr:trypsin-like peptidase domain-containing protein [Kangiella sp. TOML190]